MASVSIQIKGLDELIKSSKKAGAAVANELAKAVVDSSLVLQRRAFQEVPVKTGRLQKSIKTFKQGKFVGGIIAGASYAPFVEHGTKPHIIKIRTAKTLSDGKSVFGPIVHHPGTKANPFMGRTADKEKNEVKRRFEKAAETISKMIKT